MLGDSHYRKWTVYKVCHRLSQKDTSIQMAWKLDMRTCKSMCGAPNGGPLAVTKVKASPFHAKCCQDCFQIGKSSNGSDFADVYTSSGPLFREAGL